MPSFTPPVDQANGLTERGADPLSNRLGRHLVPTYAGRNVFILDDDTVTEEWPPATYNADGTILQVPEDRVVVALYGGHGAYEVSDAQAVLLTDAGYTID